MFVTASRGLSPQRLEPDIQAHSLGVRNMDVELRNSETKWELYSYALLDIVITEMPSALILVSMQEESFMAAEN